MCALCACSFSRLPPRSHFRFLWLIFIEWTFRSLVCHVWTPPTHSRHLIEGVHTLSRLSQAKLETSKDWRQTKQSLVLWFGRRANCPTLRPKVSYRNISEWKAFRIQPPSSPTKPWSLGKTGPQHWDGGHSSFINGLWARGSSQQCGVGSLSYALYLNSSLSISIPKTIKRENSHPILLGKDSYTLLHLSLPLNKLHIIFTSGRDRLSERSRALVPHWLLLQGDAAPSQQRSPECIAWRKREGGGGVTGGQDLQWLSIPHHNWDWFPHCFHFMSFILWSSWWFLMVLIAFSTTKSIYFLKF